MSYELSAKYVQARMASLRGGSPYLPEDVMANEVLMVNRVNELINSKTRLTDLIHHGHPEEVKIFSEARENAVKELAQKIRHMRSIGMVIVKK